MIYDTSGGKSPNATSKDVRAYNNKIANCAFKSGSTCFGQPFKPEAHIWGDSYLVNDPDSPLDGTCVMDKEDTEFIQKYGMNNYNCQLPDTNDYWAGAVQACNGVSKLPTMAQVAEIANYLYDRSDIGAYDSTTPYHYDEEQGFYDGTIVNQALYKERAAKLGLPSSGSTIWTNESGSDMINVRFLFTDYTDWIDMPRNESDYYAICTGN